MAGLSLTRAGAAAVKSRCEKQKKVCRWYMVAGNGVRRVNGYVQRVRDKGTKQGKVVEGR